MGANQNGGPRNGGQRAPGRWMQYRGEIAKYGEYAEAYMEESGWVPVEIVSRIPYTPKVLRVKFLQLWDGFITEWPVAVLWKRGGDYFRIPPFYGGGGSMLCGQGRG